MPSYTMRRAALRDLDTVMNLLNERISWLSTAGIEQWTRAFDPVMQNAVNCGETWLLYDGDSAVATLTMTTIADSDFWTYQERLQPAVYISKLATALSHKGRGLGALLVEWANWYGQQRGISRVRWDVWRTNGALQNYYRGIGAHQLRTENIDGRSSGALFEWAWREPSTDVAELIRTDVQFGPVIPLDSYQQTMPNMHCIDGLRDCDCADVHGNTPNFRCTRIIPKLISANLYASAAPYGEADPHGHGVDTTPVRVSATRKPVLFTAGDGWLLRGWYSRSILSCPPELNTGSLHDGSPYQLRLTAGGGVALFGDLDLHITAHYPPGERVALTPNPDKGGQATS